VLLRRGELAVQVDAGRGTVLRLAELGGHYPQISVLALTHHHSDHLVGMADLIITRWVLGGVDPLVVVAPEGPAARFAHRVLDIWADDIAIRQSHGQRARTPELDIRAFPPARVPKLVWQSGQVSLSAVAVRHEPVEAAVAYRFDTPEGAVVVSGDTRVCAEVEELATDADVLVHEACRTGLMRARGKSYIAEYHADTIDLGAMAERAGVRTLMLTHLEPSPRAPEEAEAFAADVRAGGFTGQLIVGEDGSYMKVAGQESPPAGE
jgi:ribonuclease Z